MAKKMKWCEACGQTFHTGLWGNIRFCKRCYPSFRGDLYR